jgi:hypothetical protein
MNIRSESHLNAQFFAALLCVILYFPSNMSRRAAIFKEDVSSLKMSAAHSKVTFGFARHWTSHKHLL